MSNHPGTQIVIDDHAETNSHVWVDDVISAADQRLAFDTAMLVKNELKLGSQLIKIQIGGRLEPLPRHDTNPRFNLTYALTVRPMGVSAVNDFQNMLIVGTILYRLDLQAYDWTAEKLSALVVTQVRTYFEHRAANYERDAARLRRLGQSPTTVGS